jgi:hypothetical protein
LEGSGNKRRYVVLIVFQGVEGCSVVVPVVGLDVGVSEVSGARLDAERVKFFAV